MTASQHLSPDQFTTMAVNALPFHNVMSSDPKAVAKIRRGLRTKGYVHDEDNPITVLKQDDRPDQLIDGNHRVEALRTAGGFLDHEVPVRITRNRPPHLPHYL